MTTKLIAAVAAALPFLFQVVPISAVEPQGVDEAPMRSYQLAKDTPTYDVAAVQSELESHRTTWNAFVGESKNYDMTFERICFCPEQWRGPFSMRVRNGEVQSATYLSETMRESSVEPDLLRGLLTVDKVFDDIQKSLDGSYVEVKVTYNETTGHPISYYSDSSKMIADDERTYKISEVLLNDE